MSSLQKRKAALPISPKPEIKAPPGKRRGGNTAEDPEIEWRQIELEIVNNKLRMLYFLVVCCSAPIIAAAISHESFASARQEVASRAVQIVSGVYQQASAFAAPVAPKSSRPEKRDLVYFGP